jgi:hypothetical protein
MPRPEEIWNLLHDGSIDEVHGGVPGDVTMRISIDYLTQRMVVRPSVSQRPGNPFG